MFKLLPVGTSCLVSAQRWSLLKVHDKLVILNFFLFFNEIFSDTSFAQCA